MGIVNSGSVCFPADLGKQLFWMSFSFYNYSVPFAGGQTNPGTTYTNGQPNISLTALGTIRLPFPNQMVDHQDIAYDQESWGTVAGAAITAVQGSSGGLAASLGAGIVGGIAGTLLNGSSNLSNKIPETNGNVANIIAQLAGVAINPFLTVMFKSPAFKKQLFRWKLSPSNSTESENVTNIIDTFRFNQLPSRVTATAGTLLAYPNIVIPSINVFNNSLFTYRFKPAVIDAFSVNYTPSGQPSFFGGSLAPTETEIMLSLFEIEYWLQDDLIASLGTNISTAGASISQSFQSTISSLANQLSTGTGALINLPVP